MCIRNNSPIVPNDSIFFQTLEDWRQQVAKFDDESPEFVLSTVLINYLEQQLQTIQHSQDLLNTVADFYFRSNCGFVPFFVKIYADELTDIITSIKPKEMDANDLYKQILTNDKLTHDLLKNAFKEENMPDKLDREIESSMVTHPDFLKVVNLLQKGNLDENRK